MSGNDAVLRPWLIIRQDGNGNRYRVGRYATRAEALRIAGRLSQGGDAEGTAQGGDVDQRYLVERLNRESGAHAS